MEKINQVIDMVEHPENYSETQVENILQDEECRQTYLTMMEMRMAFDKDAAEQKLNIDQEWELLVERQALPTSHFSWSKVAASLVGILLLSGIAVAAIHTYSSSHQEAKQELVDTAAMMSARTNKVAQDSLKHTDNTLKQKQVQHKTFDNVALCSMLDEMARYYGVSVEYRNAEAKQLRFYYEWNSEDGLDKVLAELNHSQQMSLSLEDDKIIVE